MISAKKHQSLKACVALASLASCCSAFSTVQLPGRSRFAPLPPTKKNVASGSRNSPLSALIFGWDEGDDSTTTTTTGGVYTDVFNDAGSFASCSPVGTAVAEALSYDRDRAGHLARLAVAFTPPERALQLKDIENVDVVCVREDSIEIQAIICEDGGCVSVAVPVKFPRECANDGFSEALEGCVLRNLDELNQEAESTIAIQDNRQAAEEAEQDLDELCLFNSKIEYPSWWVPPECNAALVAECDTIQRLLNEEEFQPDVLALAQDTLKNGKGGENYIVKKAKVAVIGPAGICFKVKAEYQLEADKPTHILDAMYPFGGEPMKDTASLRAAVLGAVASAEGN